MGKGAVRHTTLRLRLWFYIIQGFTNEKFCFNCQMRNEPFLIVIYHSSLVKGAMNAARICKLRNGVKKKRLNFFFFHRAKAEQRP
jgi:hypothetical protein